MPLDDIYWNSIDFGSDESLHNPKNNNNNNKKSYIDPWDLENYAYIQNHLESIEPTSSQPESNSSDFLIEANSTSFYYVPGVKQLQENKTNPIKYDRDYAAIDELTNERLGDSFESETEESPYEEDFTDNSMLYVYETRNKWKNNNLPTNSRERSFSFSYGDNGNEEECENRQDIYTKLDDYHLKDTVYCMGYNRKPTNFGLSNYGHLKIDYSYNWNNLHKYICN